MSTRTPTPDTAGPAGSAAAVDAATATALKLYVVLLRTVDAVTAHARRQAEAHGLSYTEFAILEALYTKGRLLLGDVQRLILVSSGGITFLVDKLEKRGLVRRAQCETDRRARFAELTDAGRELIAGAFPGHAEAIREAMGGLSAADQRQLTSMLRALGTAAANLPPGDGTPSQPG